MFLDIMTCMIWLTFVYFLLIFMLKAFYTWPNKIKCLCTICSSVCTSTWSTGIARLNKRSYLTLHQQEPCIWRCRIQKCSNCICRRSSIEKLNI